MVRRVAVADQLIASGECSKLRCSTREAPNVIKVLNAAIRFTLSLPADALKELYRQYGAGAAPKFGAPRR